jgi:hypothetical protein
MLNVGMAGLGQITVVQVTSSSQKLWKTLWITPAPPPSCCVNAPFPAFCTTSVRASGGATSARHGSALQIAIVA